MEFGSLPYVVAFLLNTLHALIITPHLVLAILIYHYIQKKKIFINSSLLTITAAFLLTILEYYTPQQFNTMIGQPLLVFGEYLGWAPIAGLPVFSFFSFLIIFEAIYFIKRKSFNKFNMTLIILFIASNPILVKKDKKNSKKSLNIRLVQANISNFLKIESESGETNSVTAVIDRYKKLSLLPFKSNQKLDLIIWPETAYPYPIETESNNIKNSFLPYLFQEVANAQKSNLFIGGYNRIKGSVGYYMTEYNSNFFMNRDGRLTDIYYKQLLIPFGETLPFGPFNKFLSEQIPNIAFFAEGDKNNAFTLDTGHKLLNSICYEILSPEFIRKALNDNKSDIHALVNLTNDSWYANTAEPEQHLFLASWRSLEFSLPMIRSTNTGISTIVDRFGQEIVTLDEGKTGNLDYTLELPERNIGLYEKLGIWSFLLLLSVIFIFHLLMLKYKNVKK
jgi:apolipoprotein N-acyltransferase